MPQLLDALYVAGHKPFDLQIERLVALLRVTLTLFCLGAFATIPGRQQPDLPIFELILAAYTIFGLVVALLPFVGRFRTGWQLPVHVIDIGVISVVMYFLKDFSNTFFILYVFVLLSATIRWNTSGALWTTGFLLALQVLLFRAIGTATQFFIQCAFLFMIGGMFAFFGIARARSAERLTQLAGWPSAKAQSYSNIDDHWLDASLAHIARVFEAPRVLVVWEIAQEPYVFTALFADGKCQQDRMADNVFGNLVSEELAGATFAVEAVKSKQCLTSTGTKHYAEPMVNEALQDRFQIARVCSAPLEGDICQGRVFMLDRSDWGEDDLTLAVVVASRLRIELEHYALCVRLEETVASRERTRLARDLHDGILQSLAATGLQLKMIAARTEEKLQDDIDKIRKQLFGEQQRIRAFVEGRQPQPPQQPFNLQVQMQLEAEEIEFQWGCRVLHSVTPQDATVPTELIRQIKFLLAEAAANAVKHGKALNITIAIERTPEAVELRIADNGFGLKGTTGSYSQSELAALGIGPQSIRKRIVDLGGTLSLSSSHQGVELRITLPCHEPAAQQTTVRAHAFG